MYRQGPLNDWCINQFSYYLSARVCAHKQTDQLSKEFPEIQMCYLSKEKFKCAAANLLFLVYLVMPRSSGLSFVDIVIFKTDAPWM